MNSMLHKGLMSSNLSNEPLEYAIIITEFLASLNVLYPFNLVPQIDYAIGTNMMLKKIRTTRNVISMPADYSSVITMTLNLPTNLTPSRTFEAMKSRPMVSMMQLVLKFAASK